MTSSNVVNVLPTQQQQTKMKIVDSELLQKKDDTISELESTVLALKIQNRELFSRIEKLKSQAEISEDKFNNT